MHEKRIGGRDDDAKKLGIPFILSEFGACFDSENCYEEIIATIDACDNHLAGWAYWMFKNYEDFTTSAGTKS